MYVLSYKILNLNENDHHYENKFTKYIRPTEIQHIFTKS